MKFELEKEIEGIIKAYEDVVTGIEKKALNNNLGRAYGGIIRAGKGQLVESIAKQVVILAGEKLGLSSDVLKITKKKLKIPIKNEYIKKIKDEYLKKHIEEHFKEYFYPLEIDWIVSIKNKPIMAIECKAYTENAMLKRILVDFTLLKNVYPNMSFVLFQLESQLGGDYSELKDNPLGSPSTHTLLSYFDIPLVIITLLKGERKVEKPIHKKEFFKPLTKESIERAIEKISQIIEQHKNEI
jgi:hypothetical protein